MYIKFIMRRPCAFKFCGSFQHNNFCFQFHYGKKTNHYPNKNVPIKNYSKKAVFKILEIPFCKTAAVQDFRIFPEIILSKNIRC